MSIGYYVDNMSRWRQVTGYNYAQITYWINNPGKFIISCFVRACSARTL